MEAAIPSPPRAPTENELRHVRGLLERGEHAQAMVEVRRLRAHAPTNRDLLYMLAVSQRYLGHVEDALATLATLEAFHPRYPRLFQERGHCFVTMRSADSAIAAFEQAVHLNPALPASWSALQMLYRIAGRPDRSQNAADNVARLKSMPQAVVTAYSMYADGELEQSEHLVRQYLVQHGDHVEGLRLLAKIGIDRDALGDALYLLERVLALIPDHHAARYEYTVALLKQHKFVAAEKELQRLLANDPNNSICRTTYATTLLGLGQVDRAIALYQELLIETPRDPELQLSLGHALKTRGEQAEAIAAYRATTSLRAKFGEAYWSLANLKTYRFADDELAGMRRDEADPTTQPVDRYHLCFALGKALEDRGDYAGSFTYYERGNALKRAESRYCAELVERDAQLQIEVCSREFFAARRGFGCQSAAPIFIVGLPRSGSTLVEQILASHTQVDATMELAEVTRLVASLQGTNREAPADQPVYPAILARLTAADFERLGEQYLADSSHYRGTKPHFVDKMPNNFRYLGLIQLMLPNAKIIDARREPMACCFSNFKQLFAAGQEFAYSLDDLARYYRVYSRLMAHWQAARPGAILCVKHEDVVADLESQVRRILDFCALDFEPGCVEFHKTKRPIHTASSEQVRQPLYQEGVDHWRHYEPWLGPLAAALAAGNGAVP